MFRLRCALGHNLLQEFGSRETMRHLDPSHSRAFMDILGWCQRQHRQISASTLIREQRAPALRMRRILVEVVRGKEAEAEGDSQSKRPRSVNILIGLGMAWFES